MESDQFGFNSAPSVSNLMTLVNLLILSRMISFEKNENNNWHFSQRVNV